MKELLTHWFKMQHSINIGVIGCGMVGEHHIAGLINNKQINLCWVCDLEKEKLDRIKKKYAIESSSNNYQNMIRDKNVDAIIICTQPNTHFELATHAINANKHVLIEKPLVINSQELAEFSSTIKSAPSLVVMDASARHSRLQPKFIAIKSIIDSGQLGHVYAIHHRAV